MWTGVSKKREAKIRREVEKQVKELLVEELTPVIREQITEEIGDEAYQKAKADLQKEAETLKPEPRERAAFREFVREVELDAHAQATVASNEADIADKALRRSRRWMNPLGYLLLLTILPAAYMTYATFGLGLALGATVATMLIALGIIAGTNSSRHERLTKRFKAKRKVASDYLIVAEQAKAYRTVHAERLDTKRKLDQLTTDLQTKKARLDQDHWPQVESLHSARETVRHRIEVPKYQAFDEFDEQLAEAEAEAEAKAAASKATV